MPTVSVLKKDSRQRIVFGEVYAPDRPDADAEFMTAETIQKMAYGFMKSLKLDRVDSMHNNVLVKGACVVESFIARKGDPEFIEGAWVIGVHVPGDADWDKIEKGEWNGFSIEAMVKKEQVNVQIEVPPVLTGKTLKADNSDHQHTFYVGYDSEGKFLGGKTDQVNGHIHLIKRGTMTEIASEHRHRFSHVEDVVITH